MNSVGERLREARLARGLTQQQLASGVASKGFICQVERNRATPSLAKLRVMADRLGLPLGYFTGEKATNQVAYLRKSAEVALKAREPEQALAAAGEALVLAPTANERADLYRIRGCALDALGQLEESLSAHQLAAATAPPDDPELNASIYVEIGTVLAQKEQFNAAMEAGLRALKWLEQCHHAEPALRSRLLTNLGRAAYGMGQLAAADAYFHQALAAATDAENVFRIANAHMALGVSARAIGDLDRAIEHCNRALDLHSRLRHERSANLVLNNLGDVHYAAGRKREAEHFQRQCLERARELKDDFGVGVAATELARYALERGEADHALRLAGEGRTAAGNSGDHLHQALATALEGSALERLGDKPAANRKLHSAMISLAGRNAAGKLAEVCSMYADVLRQRGQVDRAFAFMRMAAERDFASLPRLIRQSTR